MTGVSPTAREGVLVSLDILTAGLNGDGDAVNVLCARLAHGEARCAVAFLAGLVVQSLTTRAEADGCSPLDYVATLRAGAEALFR